MNAYKRALGGTLLTVIGFGVASGIPCGLGHLVAWLLFEVTGILDHPQQAVIAFGAPVGLLSFGLALFVGYRVTSAPAIWLIPKAFGNALLIGTASAIGSVAVVFNCTSASETIAVPEVWYLMGMEAVVVIMGFIFGAYMRTRSEKPLPHFRGFVVPEDSEPEQ